MSDAGRTLVLVVGIVGLLAGVGVGLGIGMAGRPEPGIAADPVAPEGAAEPTPGRASPASLRERVQGLEKELRERDERIRELEEATVLRDAEVGPGGTGPDGAGEGGEEAPRGTASGSGAAAAGRAYRFGLKGETPVLDKADWRELGGLLMDLKAGLQPILEELQATGDVSLKTQMEVGKKNQPLAFFTIKAYAETGGVMPNSAFTHPAVVASMIRAALEAAGDPLSSLQDEVVRRAGEAWARREEARLAGYTEATFQLQKLIEEVESRQRFIEDVRLALSATQQAVLFDPVTEGRGGLDLFSPALSYATRRPVTEPTREALEKTLITESFKLLGIERNPEEYLWLATEWLQRVPEALVPVSEAEGRIDLLFPTLEKLHRCARAQLTVLQRLVAQENFDAETLQRIRQLVILAVPQVVVREAEEGK